MYISGEYNYTIDLISQDIMIDIDLVLNNIIKINSKSSTSQYSFIGNRNNILNKILAILKTI